MKVWEARVILEGLEDNAEVSLSIIRSAKIPKAPPIVRDYVLGKEQWISNPKENYLPPFEITCKSPH